LAKQGARRQPARKTVAALAVATLPFALLACDDDDNDGNIDNPDLDPGGGTGLPGDDSIGD
jgi:hypothetical protein